MTDEERRAAAPMPEGGVDAMPRAVTAFFDTSDAAEKATRDLIAAGVPADDVRVAGGEAPESKAMHPHGFWEMLKDFFMPDEDRHLYVEGLRRGGFAVSVKTDSAAYEHVLDVLDRDGAVDMEERSADWRTEGWTGSSDGSTRAAEERAFTPPDSGTAGFGASMADQPLFDPRPATGETEPDFVRRVPEDAEPRQHPGAPAVSAESGRGEPAPAADPPDAISDLSHGRARVRSYIAGQRSRGDLDL